MPYPQTRVFNPSALLSGTVPLPRETPYLYFDLAAADGFVTANDLKYSVEHTLIVLLWTPIHVLTIVCPTGWTTPEGPNTDFELPGIRAGKGAWRVLWDVPQKNISLLSAEGVSFEGGPSIPPPNNIGPGPGAFPVAGFTSPIVQVDESGGTVTLAGANNLETDIAATISKISTGTNGIVAACPTGWTVNGVLNMALVLPGSDVAAVGAWLYYTDIENQAIVVRPAA